MKTPGGSVKTIEGEIIHSYSNEQDKYMYKYFRDGYYHLYGLYDSSSNCVYNFDHKLLLEMQTLTSDFASVESNDEYVIFISDDIVYIYDKGCFFSTARVGKPVPICIVNLYNIFGAGNDSGFIVMLDDVFFVIYVCVTMYVLKFTYRGELVELLNMGSEFIRSILRKGDILIYKTTDCPTISGFTFWDFDDADPTNGYVVEMDIAYRHHRYPGRRAHRGESCQSEPRTLVVNNTISNELWPYMIHSGEIVHVTDNIVYISLKEGTKYVVRRFVISW